MAFWDKPISREFERVSGASCDFDRGVDEMEHPRSATRLPSIPSRVPSTPLQRLATVCTLRAIARLFVFGFPITFVLASWLAGAGFPYYHDNNETLLVYVEARNLEIWDPNEYGWLAATDTDPAQPRVEHVYTHMPNGPRYLHYLLLRAGIRDLRHHTLILSLIATTLTVVLLSRALKYTALQVVSLAIVLDYPGFLAWTINTYRVWIFVLYFGMVLAVARHRPLWVGVTAFAAFQADIGVSLFICAAAVAQALLMHGRQATWLIVTLVAGTLLSVAIFGAQVLSYYGWDGFTGELAATYVRRGPGGAQMALWTYFIHSWLGFLRLFTSVGKDMYNPFVAVILMSGLVVAPWLLVRRQLSEAHRFVAILTVSATFGAIVTSTLLFGYFVDAFIESQLPFASLMIALSIGTVALGLHRLVVHYSRLDVLGAVCGAAMLLPVVAASVSLYRPPVTPDLIQVLTDDYQGRSIVGPGLIAEFAFAMTGGRAASLGGLGSSAGFPAVAADLDRLRSMRDADGTLLFLCLEPVYPAHATNPLFAACRDLVADMAPKMRGTVASGQGWMLMRFDPDAGTITAETQRPLPSDYGSEK